jgi:tellurite resistance protein
MTLFIIFGSRGVTGVKGSGTFACPGCGGSQQQYLRKRVRRFFTLYFIPVIPLDKIGEYIECQRCRNTYNEQVLNFDPKVEQAKARDAIFDHIKRVMILTAVADGHINDAVLDTVRDFYQNLSGTTLSRPELDREVAQARQANAKPADYIRRFAGDLNENGKELVIKAAHSVLAAGGELGDNEHALLNEIGSALNLTAAHFRGILADLGA